MILASCFTLRGHGTHIDLLWFLFLVDRICPLMQEHFLFLRLNKGLTFLQSAFSIWITKRFSLVRECNDFLQCCILTLGPARQCLKIITDGYLQIQNYKIEMQLKPKLHQLWRIALCFGNYKLQLSVFLKTVWVFWPERVVPPRGNSLWTVLLLPLCDQIACYVPTEKPMSIRPVNSQCSRQ